MVIFLASTFCLLSFLLGFYFRTTAYKTAQIEARRTALHEAGRVAKSIGDLYVANDIFGNNFRQNMVASTVAHQIELEILSLAGRIGQ